MKQFDPGDSPSIASITDRVRPLAVGMPGEDEVGHLDRLALAELADLEGLLLDLGAVLLEMLDDQLLLLLHSGRAAGLTPRR